VDWPPPGVRLPEPTRLGEVTWLEPYPDVMLEGLADAAPGPEARYEATEAISVAFVTALQLLPPRQRAALILRDVLGFRASEAAGILDSTEESVTSALKRARSALEYQRAQVADSEPPTPGSAVERALVQRFAQAYEAGDVHAVVALLTEDAWLIMPPIPMRYQGRELAARFWSATAFRPGRSARLVPTRANGQPAFGLYIRDPHTPIAHANGIIVLTITGGQISTVTGFPDNSTLRSFGLPRTLPD
jgi:RNA polymerase sigma-70 factor (ECF subfamily)